MKVKSMCFGRRTAGPIASDDYVFRVSSVCLELNVTSDSTSYLHHI